jgi:hypothetical protein
MNIFYLRELANYIVNDVLFEYYHDVLFEYCNDVLFDTAF